MCDRPTEQHDSTIVIEFATTCGNSSCSLRVIVKIYEYKREQEVNLALSFNLQLTSTSRGVAQLGSSLRAALYRYSVCLRA